MVKAVKRRWFAAAVGILVFGILVGGAMAGTRGKIAGTVKDARTGEPLPGVNIVIVGTQMGASTDEQGRYFILNVPPGTYSLQARYIGYRSVTKTGVRVEVDATTEVNFSLEPTVIEGEAVTVVAQRPLVEKTLTHSKSVVGVEELNNTLPVAGVMDIVETTASNFRGYIRGGQKYETRYVIDGVDVTDTYYSAGTGAFGGEVGHAYTAYRESEAKEAMAVHVNQSQVQELDVYAGIFTAEYPSATAGIVNLVTKEGGKTYSGKIFARSLVTSGIHNVGSNIYWDYKFPGETETFYGYDTERKRYQAAADAGDAASARKARLMTWTPDIARDRYYYDPADSSGIGRPYDIEANLSGPLPFTDKGGFFITAGYNHYLSGLPFEVEDHITLSGKVHYNFSPSKKLTGFLQVTDGGKLFNFVNWKYNPKWKYYMEGAPRYKDLGLVGYLKWTHTLSPRTFYEVVVSQANKSSWIGYPDDDGDGMCEIDEKGDFITFESRDDFLKYVGGTLKYDTLYNEDGSIKKVRSYIKRGSADGYVYGHFGDPNYRVFFYSETDPESGINDAKLKFAGQDGWYRSAYPTPLYSYTKRNTTSLKADITSQVTYNHQIKAGVLFRYHSVSRRHIESPLGGAGVKYPYSRFWVDYFDFNPMEVAGYIQDRIEYSGLIINIGLRVDGYYTDTYRFKNDFHPFDYIADDWGDLVELRPAWGKKVPWKFYFSPRIGVSHPVSDKMAMHYSFGQLFQYPNFATLYQWINFGKYASSPNIDTVWPEQDAVRATAYEMGLQYAISDMIGIDITGYYRDVENYRKLSFQLTPYKGPGMRFYHNWGYADSRGIEVTVVKRPGKWSSLRLSYAYSYIKEPVPVSAGSAIRTAYNTKVDSAKMAHLPWNMIDQYNYYERNVLMRSGAGNVVSGGYDRPHRFAGTIMLFLPYGVNWTNVVEAASGFYYQLTENVENDPYFTISRKLGQAPWTWQWNLRISKEFRFAGHFRANLFGEVRNVLNRKNILGYANTPFLGGKDQTLWELGPDLKPNTGDEHYPEGVYRQPTDIYGRLLYGEPRTIWAGLEFSF
ncbi:MAG: TonB-dependent receptor [Calditrichaeota bacterium]|nr:TonB-dependent receptor [Calditrichota bacterium]